MSGSPPDEARRVVFRGFGGIELVADARGPADGWPVLFLHGGGQTRHAWGGTAGVIAGHGWRAISLDLRGHGESGWAPNGDYSFTAFCADCVSVVDQLGRPPVIVGASLGGVSALLAEGTSDRTVSSGLVIVDVTHKSNPAGVARIQDFMRSGLTGFATLEDAAEAIAAYTPNRPKRINPEGLKRVLRLREDGRWHWHWDPAFLDGPRTEMPPEDRMELLALAVAEVRVPTLLVRGALSDVVTDDGVADFLQKVPSARVFEVPGAAHMVAGDRNDVFAGAVLDFLDHDIALSSRRSD